jgi:ketosteroid isomerase-like protein
MIDSTSKKMKLPGKNHMEKNIKRGYGKTIFRKISTCALVLAILVGFAQIAQSASKGDDEKTVAALDNEYQAAVKANDAVTMDRILADNFILVTGRGAVSTKGDLLKDARDKQRIYEHQEEEQGSQKVRVWRDTAVVTALLWIKGVEEAKPFDYKLWFSDTYVRTPTGWRYVFGQASLPLPKADAK